MEDIQNAISAYKTAIENETLAHKTHSEAAVALRKSEDALRDAGTVKKNALLKVNALIEREARS